jgi:chromosome segregation ATPase
MRRAVSEDKDKNLIERKQQTRIHKELETLERNYLELTHQRKADVQMKQNEIDNLNKVLSQLEEQKSSLSTKCDSNEGEIRELKKKLMIKSD